VIEIADPSHNKIVNCKRFGLPTKQCNVLIIDNELHPEEAAWRNQQVCSQLGYDYTESSQRVRIESLRGSVVDLLEMESYFDGLLDDEWQPDIIILDAFYRFLPEGISENDNAAMTQLFYQLDRYASLTNAAIINVHHSSKGDQSGKSVTDVGSGAGAIARAVDFHVAIRPHELADCAVFEAKLRSFPPMRAFTMKWEWPLWERKEGIDAVCQTPASKKQDKNDEPIITKFLAFAVENTKFSASELRTKFGGGLDRARRIVNKMEDRGLIKCLGQEKRKANEVYVYEIADFGRSEHSRTEGPFDDLSDLSTV